MTPVQRPNLPLINPNLNKAYHDRCFALQQNENEIFNGAWKKFHVHRPRDDQGPFLLQVQCSGNYKHVYAPVCNKGHWACKDCIQDVIRKELDVCPQCALQGEENSLMNDDELKEAISQLADKKLAARYECTDCHSKLEYAQVEGHVSCQQVPVFTSLKTVQAKLSAEEEKMYSVLAPYITNFNSSILLSDSDRVEKNVRMIVADSPPDRRAMLIKATSPEALDGYEKAKKTLGICKIYLIDLYWQLTEKQEVEDQEPQEREVFGQAIDLNKRWLNYLDQPGDTFKSNAVKYANEKASELEAGTLDQHQKIVLRAITLAQRRLNRTRSSNNENMLAMNEAYLFTITDRILHEKRKRSGGAEGMWLSSTGEPSTKTSKKSKSA
ncbi:hypothetical protein M3P05_04145 [Sansalvadorimonas sp. 2012CJ34-2]|uniref:Uncharacterized protein n=1 Tax=Parendozoicomonas callyspongiae TaxID=2942213 RepID=A0ABT0PCM2_9GAMM|nr:RING finger protein [Sansalvadorimonas sp. 2012CJ34-2]MCL6269133.1 hypothetical protein [Sansalvadorimonas sp. 2012CJ34-2]